MAIDDFDTSRMRQCMECHRHDFDSGDWQFVGYDDLAELYICPDCVELANYCNDDFVTRSAEQRNDAESGTCPRCAGKGNYQIGIYHETCDVCNGSGHV